MSIDVHITNTIQVSDGEMPRTMIFALTLAFVEPRLRISYATLSQSVDIIKNSMSELAEEEIR